MHAHVSVLVQLMKGENDHQLQWPFEHDVTCGILNWKRDENHVFQTVLFKVVREKDKERVMSREVARSGLGHHSFLSHASLYDSGDEQVQCVCK